MGSPLYASSDAYGDLTVGASAHVKKDLHSCRAQLDSHIECAFVLDDHGKARVTSSQCKGTLSLDALAGGPGHTAKLFVAGPTDTRLCQVSFTEP